MANVIPSVLISDISGKAGTVVFSKWKGRLYVRRHCIPANPNTPDQQTQRGWMRAVVAWWHDLEQQVQDHCGELAAVEQISGFNAFVARNVKDLYDMVHARIMPLNAETNPIADNLGASAGASGQIDLTWTLGEAAGANKVYVLTGLLDADGNVQNLTLFQKETTAASAGALTVTGLTPGTNYGIWLLVEHIATSKFSIARYNESLTGA